MKFTIALTLATSAAAFTGPNAFRTPTALDANLVDTLASLEGPGQVWGADGIAVGKEESELRGYDNFGLFSQRLAESGIGPNLAGPGPWTIFAPTDTAIIAYELQRGPFDANAINYCIVTGSIASSAIANTPLTSVTGETLAYSRKFRKDFVNDSIIGEKTFGLFSDFPTDVVCDNGVIHSIGIALERP
mmetsp:Transcript_20138/g.19381  ORF Transcript_20138/g.19381 Transcript_20138/m.19381 type:complete len:189 (-) Transcript_20138:66-632(-)|eukprot:CAMPEP_0197828934 /NCGR_PEP_ID=MMETSP1437-20131217/5425_1 /TAXON_ID=49252 ORGANISM="Eucampia antarctica, Strain CCMP1452" /NCGR_SAMPLE_ID=MMETSP1437 /ASSEMBLY_ACC=CAM_ASM_001096 /LENGTH=188 /DNA_ID=CAMNT_0043430359 /DNA_START=56 /DNA_END=622 /DNA_ORIENTATION=+